MIAPTMTAGAAAPTVLARAEQSHEARFARLVALILDTIFVSILIGIASAVYGETRVTGTWNPSGFSSLSEQTILPTLWTGVIWLGYYIVCEAMFSATPGKAMNGLRVVSVDGSPLGLGSIVVRNLLRLIDVLPGMYLLGGVLVMVMPYSQRTGDYVARTTVVLRAHAVEPRSARASGRRAGVLLVAIVVVAFVFSAGFDYFGRPPLEIQKLFEEHRLMDPQLTSYSLGTPTWSWGHVKYPLTAREPAKACTGWIELDWYGIMGWQQSSGELDCLPAS